MKLCCGVCVQISSRFIGLSNVSVAFLALSLLLLSGVLSWRDCLEYTPAWDTLLWFGVVIGMSTNLNTLVTPLSPALLVLQIEAGTRKAELAGLGA